MSLGSWSRARTLPRGESYRTVWRPLRILAAACTAAASHAVFAFEFGHCNSPDLGAAFQIFPSEEIRFLHLKLTSHRLGIVVAEKFHRRVDAELVKRPEYQRETTVGLDKASVYLHGVGSLCHGASLL